MKEYKTNEAIKRAENTSVWDEETQCDRPELRTALPNSVRKWLIIVYLQLVPVDRWNLLKWEFYHCVTWMSNLWFWQFL